MRKITGLKVQKTIGLCAFNDELLLMEFFSIFAVTVFRFML